jgi:methionine-rich copper-binding protein CopC
MTVTAIEAAKLVAARRRSLTHTKPLSMNKSHCTAAALATAVATSSAFAHAKLQKSEPENGSTVKISPAVLKLRYSETVEPAMSGVKFSGPGDKAVQAGTPVLAEGDDKTLVVRVPKLPAGDYRVERSTMGHDAVLSRINQTVRFVTCCTQSTTRWSNRVVRQGLTTRDTDRRRATVSDELRQRTDPISADNSAC